MSEHATSRRPGPDRPQFLTGLFLVVLYGAFIAVLWKIGSPSV